MNNKTKESIPIKCDSCEEVKICNYVEDPYAKEIHDESIWLFLCDKCFEDSVMDI